MPRKKLSEIAEHEHFAFDAENWTTQVQSGEMPSKVQEMFDQVERQALQFLWDSMHVEVMRLGDDIFVSFWVGDPSEQDPAMSWKLPLADLRDDEEGR